MEHIQYVYWLSCIKGIGCVKIGHLLEKFGSEEEIFKASRQSLYEVAGLREVDIYEILHSKNTDNIKYSYEKMKKSNIHLTYKGHKHYPKKLYNIYNSPYSLFYKGRLPYEDKLSIAVVGARNASYRGCETAKKIGKELAENGLQVISGLARGVDISSQIGALMIAGGRTFAVLGCGADICYPRQNIEQYMLMQENGGIISEYSPGMPPVSGNFPMRNRIISGLSDGILVIEAREGSGSLITAELGLEQGKDIFVVPGNIDDSLYSGSNELIKSGAALVTNTRDIMDAMGIFKDDSIDKYKKKVEVMLETTEKMVYSSLSLEPAHVSEISLKCGLNIANTMEILLRAESIFSNCKRIPLFGF